MTSKNLNWKNRKTVYKPRPFLLQPACKEALWGGQKLKEHFGKQADLDNIAESWECSTHPEGPSTVTTGEHKGMLLTEVLQKYPEYLGTHPRSKGELPILVKFIDARQKLSVQVHPDDEYAKLYERGQLGKTEMWYVLEADKDAELIYGFYSDMDSVAVRQSLANGTIEKYLQKVKVQQDDVFYIPAGTVHGIGAGNLIAEVQESSNLTYRLYDYDRTDKQGQKRELHLEKALAVAATPEFPIPTPRTSGVSSGNCAAPVLFCPKTARLPNANIAIRLYFNLFISLQFYNVFGDCFIVAGELQGITSSVHLA